MSTLQYGKHFWTKDIEWNTVTNWTESYEDTIYENETESLKVSLKFFEQRPLEHLCLYAKVSLIANHLPPERLSYNLKVLRLGKIQSNQSRFSTEFKEDLTEECFIKNSFSSDRYFIKRYENVAEHFRFKMDFDYTKKGADIEVEGMYFYSIYCKSTGFRVELNGT